MTSTEYSRRRRAKHRAAYNEYQRAYLAEYRKTHPQKSGWAAHHAKLKAAGTTDYQARKRRTVAKVLGLR